MPAKKPAPATPKFKEATIEKEPVEDPAVVEYKAEITRLKYQLNEVQRLFFLTKAEVIEREKIILDLSTQIEQGQLT